MAAFIISLDPFKFTTFLLRELLSQNCLMTLIPLSLAFKVVQFLLSTLIFEEGHIFAFLNKFLGFPLLDLPLCVLPQLICQGDGHVLAPHFVLGLHLSIVGKGCKER